jgi:hypothetical protein
MERQEPPEIPFKLLTKYDSIALTIIFIPLTLSPLCLLLLERQGAYTVNLCAFYFCRQGNSTACFQEELEFMLYAFRKCVLF